MISVQANGSDLLLPVKVVPKSSRDRIMGELGGALKISVSAAPERGAANTAVCQLIAGKLGLRAGQVTVESGHSSPRKTLRISGASVELLRHRLLEPGAASGSAASRPAKRAPGSSSRQG